MCNGVHFSLENMHSLTEIDPEIRQIFFQCLSVVKRTQVKFKNVAADQCHEQIILSHVWR